MKNTNDPERNRVTVDIPSAVMPEAERAGRERGHDHLDLYLLELLLEDIRRLRARHGWMEVLEQELDESPESEGETS